MCFSNGFDVADVSRAFSKAKQEKELRKRSWKSKFTELSEADENLKVVLLGRPYTVLSQTMNNNIPEIFAQKGVKTFFQDMLDVNEKEIDSYKEELNSILENKSFDSRSPGRRTR